MNWIPLTETSQLDTIVSESQQDIVAIFKHSTRCSISAMAKSRLENGQIVKDIPFYFLDLIAFRSISNEIADRFNVYHESPQLILIKNGECFYAESHGGIEVNELNEQLTNYA